jgi:hypothetical protein
MGCAYPDVIALRSGAETAELDLSPASNMGIRLIDQPYRNITLEPLGRPTAEQIRLVRALSARSFINLLKVRFMLMRGELGFSELLPEEVERVSAQLRTAGIRYAVEPSPVWRAVFDPQGPGLPPGPIAVILD